MIWNYKLLLEQIKNLDVNMVLKAIIFDVDGTLAETEELHRKAFNKAFNKWKLGWYWDRSIYEELLKISGGKERISHFSGLFPDQNKTLLKREIDLIHQDKTKYYSEFLIRNKLLPKPGVASVIKKAKQRNIKLAIATATSLINVETLVKSIWRVQVEEIFSVVATGDEVSKNKPSAEIYNLVLEKLQTKARDCIAIEDSLNGLISAKGAGLKTIIVPSFYTKGEDFSLAEAVLTSLLNFEF